MFSIFLLREKVTVLKILALVLSVSGVVVTSVFSSDEDVRFSFVFQFLRPAHTKVNAVQTTYVGYILVSAAAVFYALTDVLYGSICLL